MWRIAEGAINISKINNITWEKSYTNIESLNIDAVMKQGGAPIHIELRPEYDYVLLYITISNSMYIELALHKFEAGTYYGRIVKIYGKDALVQLKISRKKDYEELVKQLYEFKKQWDTQNAR